jgi:SLOG cluster3 family
MKAGSIIFLSASVPYRPQWTADAKSTEIEEAIISIARAVFARQGRLLFGGHPSVSPLISAVASEYFGPDPARIKRPVITFQSEFFRGRLPDRTWEMVRMGWSTIEWTEKRASDGEMTDQEASLAEMRKWMLLEEDPPDAVMRRTGLEPPQAMIAVGGMEGVCDEAAIFLRHREGWATRWNIPPVQRVYAFKSGGGAAARLLEPVTWSTRLWPEKKSPNARHLATLRLAWDKAEIVDIETRWREENRFPPFEYQPYAAMAQWLLDVDMPRHLAR